MKNQNLDKTKVVIIGIALLLFVSIFSILTMERNLERQRNEQKQKEEKLMLLFTGYCYDREILAPDSITIQEFYASDDYKLFMYDINK